MTARQIIEDESAKEFLMHHAKLSCQLCHRDFSKRASITRIYRPDDDSGSDVSWYGHAVFENGEFKFIVDQSYQLDEQYSTEVADDSYVCTKCGSWLSYMNIRFSE